MSSVIDHYRLKMTEDDKAFFEQLGQRIANLRKTQNMTQGQLAEHLGISQQHMASFEKRDQEGARLDAAQHCAALRDQCG